MTFKIADVGNEAQLVEVTERLTDALSQNHMSMDLLDLDAEYIAVAKTILATLSSHVAASPSGKVSLT